MRIHNDDCDVEMLEESDFEDDDDSGRVYGMTTRELAFYAIQMTTLSVIRKSSVFQTGYFAFCCYC